MILFYFSVDLVMELGFLSDSYSISEQSSLSEVTVCVVMNRGVLEREVVVNVNVTDVTTEGKWLNLQ